MGFLGTPPTRNKRCAGLNYNHDFVRYFKSYGGYLNHILNTNFKISRYPSLVYFVLYKVLLLFLYIE